MAVYGYARVSSNDQDLTLQRETLKAAGCTVIREEKASGTSRKGREELNTLMQFLREGDVLVVTRLDRLARSMEDLCSLAREIKERGAILRATAQQVDTGSAAGKAFFQMLGVFAEFETNLRRERQMDGIAKAKEAGVYTGRKATIDESKVRKLRDEGLGATAIARKLGIARTSVYRVLGGAAKPHV
ncbi:MAG: recombinase family protein [Pseudomonadota bacterium]